MKISYSCDGTERTFDRNVTQIIIGRGGDAGSVDLDLAPDMMVSPQHARLWQEGDTFWIEDLESAWGTLVNGEDIRGQGKQQLHPGDSISIGEWALGVQISTEHFDPHAGHTAETLETTEEFTHVLDVSEPAFSFPNALSQKTEGRLSFFYHLPLRLVAQTHIKALFNEIVSLTLNAFTDARHCALLIKNRATGKLVLRAHLPSEKAPFNSRLAERALEEGRAFIWPSVEEKRDHNVSEATMPRDEALSAASSSTMYAPLQWREERLGVLCVEMDGGARQFDLESLRLLQAIAHHAAMALWLQQRNDDWRHEHEMQQSFLRLVSPQIAERLRQRRRIHLGGEFCHATILFSDIRGFTNLSATMTPPEVTEMLDSYFGRLVPIVFKFRGTVDKFVGDAILAVFGSPDPDTQQHLHAVKAALAMQSAMREVNAQRAAQGKHTSELGIGIHCGEVVHGLIGTTRRMEFTVIGDAVNRASRYCDGTPAGQVLVSPEVYEHVSQFVEAEQTNVSTKHEGDLIAYRILAFKGEGSTSQLRA